MDVELTIDQISATFLGFVPGWEARERGISQSELDYRLARGRLLWVHDNVYRNPAVPMTQDMRFYGAVLACGRDAVLSHRAAARLHGFPGVRRVRPEVTTPHTDLPRIDGFDVHRTVRLRPFERTVVRGVPATSKGRTALDFCAVTPLHIATEVIEDAVVTKVLPPAQLLATLERSAGRGVPGTTPLRSISLTIDELHDLESVLEVDGWRVIESLPIPAPVRQYEFVCADGRRVRFDLAWPDLRFGLDWDGKRWHGTPSRKRRTRERHESIIASAWGHQNYGWADVHDSPGNVRAEVLAEITSRLATFRAA